MAVARLCQRRTGESERRGARDEDELFHNAPFGLNSLNAG
jgi:hypothetical protein